MPLSQSVQSTMIRVRRCAQHWRKWAHARSLQRPKQPADQQQHWGMHSSHRAVSGINIDWTDLVKYVHHSTMYISLVYLLYKPGICQVCA